MKFAVYAFRIFIWIPNRDQCRVMLRPFDAGRAPCISLNHRKNWLQLLAVDEIIEKVPLWQGKPAVAFNPVGSKAKVQHSIASRASSIRTEARKLKADATAALDVVKRKVELKIIGK